MHVTEKQMDVISEYNRLDAEYREREELRTELKAMKAAAQQVITSEVVFSSDMEQLEEAFPGMIALVARSIDCSVDEFNQRLLQGIVLPPKFKEALTHLLNDPFLQV